MTNLVQPLASRYQRCCRGFQAPGDQFRAPPWTASCSLLSCSDEGLGAAHCVAGMELVGQPQPTEGQAVQADQRGLIAQLDGVAHVAKSGVRVAAARTGNRPAGQGLP